MGTSVASIGFLRDEVADICGALALGATVLRRLDRGAEATHLEGLFARVESRLGRPQASSRS
jgi:hypothetical protein